MKVYISTIVLCAYSSIVSQNLVSVYFETNESSYFLTELNFNKDSVKIDSVVGFTDYLGSTSYNLNLSKMRANTVAEHLKAFELKADKVIYRGKTGPVYSDNSGDSASRRVDIYYSFKDKSENLSKIFNSTIVGETLILKGLNFVPGYPTLLKSSTESLKELLDVMKIDDSIHIRIEGHICCHSNPEFTDGYNYATKKYDLSTARAKYVYDYLVEHGISKNRMQYIGLAKSKPVFPKEESVEQQNANRRVEIRVLAK